MDGWLTLALAFRPSLTQALQAFEARHLPRVKTLLGEKGWEWDKPERQRAVLSATFMQLGAAAGVGAGAAAQ